MHSAAWHMLQVSDVLDEEMALALAESVPVVGWRPRRTLFPWFDKGGARVTGISGAKSAALEFREFPLLRGYARRPFSYIARTGATLARLLAAQTPDAANSPLICTVPYFAPVAELWPGPVVYWLTDLIESYGSSKAIDVPALDRRMCAVATLVCPNSERLRSYLIDRGGCDPRKIVILPNATRGANLLPRSPFGPGEMPEAMRGTDRPIAGVIGNLAGNMDWLLLQELVAKTPHLTWVFVGPTTMAIPDASQRRARQGVMEHPRARFVGKQPYSELGGFARAFDVAVLPYKRCEPTYSGSSTRFYEHLVACRPILATRGLEELQRKVPLLRLFDTAEEGHRELAELEAVGYEDGLAERRWVASRDATWQVRAATMQGALDRMLGGSRLEEPVLRSA